MDFLMLDANSPSRFADFVAIQLLQSIFYFITVKLTQRRMTQITKYSNAVAFW